MTRFTTLDNIKIAGTPRLFGISNKINQPEKDSNMTSAACGA